MENNTNSIAATETPVFNPNRIAHYYDQVHRASWGRRAAGLFAGATLGLGFGALVGLGAAFIPALLVNLGVPGVTVAAGTPWLLTPLMALKSAAIYGGVGAFMGVGTATAVGESAGAVAGGLAIREHQEELAGKQNGTQTSPALQPVGENPSNIWGYSVKPGLFFAAITGAFGAFTAAVGAPLLSANTLLVLGATTGITIAAGSAAAIIASAAVFALLGGLFGIKAGSMSVALSNFYMKALSGKLFEPAAPEKSLEKSPAIAPAVAPVIGEKPPAEMAPAQEAPAPTKTFATEPKSLKPEDLAAQREVAAALVR